MLLRRGFSMRKRAYSHHFHDATVFEILRTGGRQEQSRWNGQRRIFETLPCGVRVVRYGKCLPGLCREELRLFNILSLMLLRQ